MSEPKDPEFGEPTPPPDGTGEPAPPPPGWLVGDSAANAPPPPQPFAAPPADPWPVAPAPVYEAPPETPSETISRRGFLSRASSVAMGAGLVASYGTFAAMAGRFLYPARPPLKAWLYVADVARFARGASMSYTAPDGATIAIARQGGAGKVEDFIALSSTCPHLGCKVHWEGQNQRFFCPCHNGAFDPSGKATAGPPAEAGQSLGRYPLRIESGLLYIEVPLEALPSPEEA